MSIWKDLLLQRLDHPRWRYHTTDDKQKYHMGTTVKNILITLLINTSSNLKEKVIRVKWKLSVPRSMPSLFRLGVLKLFKHTSEYLMTISPPTTPPALYCFHSAAGQRSRLWGKQKREFLEEMVAWGCKNGKFNEQFLILPLKLKVKFIWIAFVCISDGLRSTCLVYICYASCWQVPQNGGQTWRLPKIR